MSPAATAIGTPGIAIGGSGNRQTSPGTAMPSSQRLTPPKSSMIVPSSTSTSPSSTPVSSDVSVAIGSEADVGVTIEPVDSSSASVSPTSVTCGPHERSPRPMPDSRRRTMSPIIPGASVKCPVPQRGARAASTSSQDQSYTG